MPFVILFVGIQRFFRFLGGASDYDEVVEKLSDAERKLGDAGLLLLSQTNEIRRLRNGGGFITEHD